MTASGPETPGRPASSAPPSQPGANDHQTSPKLRDAALVLPLLGVFLFLPPLPEIFMAPARLAGIPLIVLYIFGVWLALILAALWLARRLYRRPRAETRPARGETDEPHGEWAPEWSGSATERAAVDPAMPPRGPDGVGSGPGGGGRGRRVPGQG